eukprot:11470733-Alexandrium_andersonii.AAC.1
MDSVTGNEALLRPVQSRGEVVLDKGLPLVTTNEEQLKLPPCQQTEMPTPLQCLQHSPMQPGDRLYAQYELIHLGDSGSFCYKRSKGNTEAMVNRIFQKGCESSCALL